MKLSRDQIITIALFLLLAMGYAMGVILPLRSQRSTLADKKQQLESQLQVDRPITQKLASLEKTTASLKVQLEQSARHIPKSVQLASLFSELNAQIAAYNVVDSKVVQLNVIKRQQYQIMPIRLQFIGQFQSVFRFIKQVEGMNRLVRINSLKMSVAPTDTTNKRKPRRTTDQASNSSLGSADSPSLTVKMNLDTFSMSHENRDTP